SKAAKLALPLVLSLAGSVAVALSAGQALSVGLFLNAVLGALSSIGLFSAAKNAAEVVTTPKEALAVMPPGTVADVTAGQVRDALATLPKGK
ncbi:MAG: hypothetical protein L0Y64_14100, partial [Myxococcaceae bacterium]|nr:hypothetical protein [Myxococcaceae bacterium]